MKLVPLTRGYSAMVDDEDYERISQYKWYALLQKKIHRTIIYAARTHYENKIIGKPKYSRMHRFIMNAPAKSQVDHIDGNPLNNQKSNLRIVTNQQNQFNTSHKNNKTGYKGVNFMSAKEHKNLKKPYAAKVMFNGKAISCGYFATSIEAAIAYDKKAKELFGEYARTNF